MNVVKSLYEFMSGLITFEGYRMKNIYNMINEVMVARTSFIYFSLLIFYINKDIISDG